ncbi:hypothetical protein MHYP_G00051230 [Metynnis hypsauchen]
MSSKPKTSQNTTRMKALLGGPSKLFMLLPTGRAVQEPGPQQPLLSSQHRTAQTNQNNHNGARGRTCGDPRRCRCPHRLLRSAAGEITQSPALRTA